MSTATTADPGAARRAPVDWTRRYALATGALYLITFAASIPAAFYFLTPVLDDPAYILGTGSGTRVVIGSLLEAVTALACVGTAVAAYPVARRHSETLALGFVTTRLVEAGVILVGVLSLLTVVTLRQDVAGAAGAGEASLLTTGRALVAVRDHAFLLGPNVCAALNALLFGTLLYRFRLVPRVIPALGLIAAPLLLAATVATILGLTEHGSVWWIPGAALIFVWELWLGIHLVVKGFRPAPGTPATA